MRAKTAAPFQLEDLKEIARRCHEANIKCYLALNTLVYDRDLDKMKIIVDAVKESGIDAIITFDLSVLSYAREQGVEVHISTQHSISNIEAVKFFAKWADRLVLARELTLEQIKALTQKIKKDHVRGPSGRLVEIEIFVHGAMCVSVSGRCGMSLFLFNTSANCGECSQPCRRAYTVTDKATGKQLNIENEYVMSPQDLCTIGMLDEILDSGVISLKIEGRGRAPEYVDEVVRCYREAIKAIEQGTYNKEKIEDWNQRLGTVYHRWMSEGFYHGQAFKYWSHGANSKATQKREFVGVVEKYYPKISVAEVKIQATDLQETDSCLVTGEQTGVLRFILKGMLIEEKKSVQAKQGDVVTFEVPERVRRGDKLYKFISSKNP
ncbi:MAG: Collagenase [Candidatus Uhrbacteria bacterium GW2011_GWF2_40_263]|nr:MAG: Collagenase [Candidatus Uhrbacteria bacterium GW2011_GWF2_40_263]